MLCYCSICPFFIVQCFEININLFNKIFINTAASNDIIKLKI